MGGIFGVASKNSCVLDLFFGIDYHSHLGTRRGGMAVYDKQKGFDRAIHNIENSPFRTKFDKDVSELQGNLGIGCISDNEPQPLLVRSHLGNFAITTVGKINNMEELIEQSFKNGCTHFLEMSGGNVNPTEIVASLINSKNSIAEGIRYAQEMIEDMHLDNFFGEEVSLNSEEIDRRGLLTKMVRIAKHEAGNLPLYYTEWNTSANEGDEFHDTPYSSALVTKTLIDNYGYVEAYSFWTFSDIFEEHGQVSGEFRGGFGLQTIHGIPKPVYRAFELMHELGEERLPKVEEQGHVGICPVMDEEGRLAILAYNQEMIGKPISQEKVEIHIKNASGTKAVIQRIDDTHANAKKQWEEMGCPTYPLPVEVQKLKEASELKTEELSVKVEGEEVVLEFELPVYGVALIKLM